MASLMLLLSALVKPRNPNLGIVTAIPSASSASAASRRSLSTETKRSDQLEIVTEEDPLESRVRVDNDEEFIRVFQKFSFHTTVTAENDESFQNADPKKGLIQTLMSSKMIANRENGVLNEKEAKFVKVKMTIKDCKDVNYVKASMTIVGFVKKRPFNCKHLYSIVVFVRYRNSFHNRTVIRLVKDKSRELVTGQYHQSRHQLLSPGARQSSMAASMSGLHSSTSKCSSYSLNRQSFIQTTPNLEISPNNLRLPTPANKTRGHDRTSSFKLLISSGDGDIGIGPSGGSGGSGRCNRWWSSGSGDDESSDDKKDSFGPMGLFLNGRRSGPNFDLNGSTFDFR
ncbi:uncharacterized protein LOC119998635 [Tripterygium wilfordii]|uniref:uncharacterized protein LOC119998635 n=1 Tax=Tripterygium wilfordii TaxID=458696 RepID=UPI0018F80B56|nr:uncharacterized protein LOC119998635 [Tripterygium wilfordii]